jgi:hypothetical protein
MQGRTGSLRNWFVRLTWVVKLLLRLDMSSARPEWRGAQSR